MKRIRKVLLLLFVLGGIVLGQLYSPSSQGYQIWRSRVHSYLQNINFSTAIWHTSIAEVVWENIDIPSNLVQDINNLTYNEQKLSNFKAIGYVKATRTSNDILILEANNSEYIIFVSLYKDSMNYIHPVGYKEEYKTDTSDNPFAEKDYPKYETWHSDNFKFVYTAMLKSEADKVSTFLTVNCMNQFGYFQLENK